MRAAAAAATPASALLAIAAAAPPAAAETGERRAEEALADVACRRRAAAASARPRRRQADLERPTVERLAVVARPRGLGLARIGKGYRRAAEGPAGRVERHPTCFNCSAGLEKPAELGLEDVVRHVSHLDRLRAVRVSEAVEDRAARVAGPLARGFLADHGLLLSAAPGRRSPRLGLGRLLRRLRPLLDDVLQREVEGAHRDS